MDSLIAAASRALATGDPLGALNRVALRDDPPALALRGIAMAQLGDLPRATVLLRRARRGFGVREPLSHAKCVLAEAEIALVTRDLTWPSRLLDAARATLEHHGDRINAAHARLIAIRRLTLIGRLEDAETALAEFDASPLPPAARTAHELTVAGIAMRRLHVRTARVALANAEESAREAGIATLTAEVDGARRLLDQPAARLITNERERLLSLDDVAALLESQTLVVDACRHAVRAADTSVALASRPALFVLARALAEAWPSDVARATLIARAFRGRRPDESYRARLRVEVGRLRAALAPLAGVDATQRGFALVPHGRRDVAVLAWPVEEKHSAVLALLADGESWSTSALAIALGVSQRTVQRALESLATAGRVRAIGRGRARRWMAPSIPGFATTLLLPAPLPIY